MSQISLQSVSYRYPSHRRPALLDIDLTIEPGEFVVLAGASGSGKSTLLGTVSGLVPHFHGGEFNGRALIAGMDSYDHPPSVLAGAVGTLFQDPETQLLMGTPRAELAFPLENRGWAPAAIARAVEETALALGIDRLLERPTAELSGGESQRVALGATLAPGPAIVCLDEPTSQLDPVAGDELIALLRRLNDDRDLTILLAEHRLERCLPYADRVLALDHGRLVFDGDPVAFLGWALANAPTLATPGARLLDAVGCSPATSVKGARRTLRAAIPDFDVRLAAAASVPAPAPVPAPDDPPPTGLSDPPTAPALDGPRTLPAAAGGRGRRRRGRGRGLLPRDRSPAGQALVLNRVWHEIVDGPAILRGVSLSIQPGERVALMGRNGAGKSTLLSHVAGLLAPTRGTVAVGGRVALVLQNPGAYLVHETVAQEAPAVALARFGLTELAERHPRELSGGERQRLALAVVLGDGSEVEPPALVCLDEPTRGMDRGAKAELTAIIAGLPGAVLVATHDPEFVAAFADRVLLMGAGQLIADGPAAEVLAGGSYFTTETARILSGLGGALTPSQGATLLGTVLAGSDRVEPDLESVR